MENTNHVEQAPEVTQVQSFQEIADYSPITSEERESWTNPSSIELADMEAPPAEEEVEVPQEEQEQLPTDGFISLDGEQIPVDQAREWLSKGKDATKKWQEASELKRQAEADIQRVQYVSEMESVWNSGPQGQVAVITALQKMAGIDPTTPSYEPVKSEDLSDEGRMLVNENNRLKQEVATIKHQFDQVINRMEEYVQAQKGQDLASQTAVQLKAEYGVEVTAKDLNDSINRTGIKDYEASWLKENKENLKKGIFKAGVEQAKAKKPNMPGGNTRTFDPNDPKLTADKMISLFKQGFVPKE